MEKQTKLSSEPTGRIHDKSLIYPDVGFIIITVISTSFKGGGGGL